jgi:hypothetical protein
MPEGRTHHRIRGLANDPGDRFRTRQAVIQRSQPRAEMEAPVLNTDKFVRTRAADTFKLLEELSRRVVFLVQH